MIVKHCPDPSVLAFFRFKAPDKWSANKTQVHLDCYQSELKEWVLAKPKWHNLVKHTAIHAQTSKTEYQTHCGCANASTIQAETVAMSDPHVDDNCIKI